jgi:hypothetical protein
MARVFVEIKLVGQKKMAWIKENKSPLPEHVDQIGQQFLVTNFERGFYAAYTTNEKMTTSLITFAYRLRQTALIMNNCSAN